MAAKTKKDKTVNLKMQVSLKRCDYQYKAGTDEYFVAGVTINGRRIPAKAVDALVAHLWRHHLGGL